MAREDYAVGYNGRNPGREGRLVFPFYHARVARSRATIEPLPMPVADALKAGAMCPSIEAREEAVPIVRNSRI